MERELGRLSRWLAGLQHEASSYTLECGMIPQKLADKFRMSAKDQASEAATT